MSALMASRGPITSPTRSWEEQQQRQFELQPRGWDGFRVGPESGLSELEIKALRDNGLLER